MIRIATIPFCVSVRSECSPYVRNKKTCPSRILMRPLGDSNDGVPERLESRQFGPVRLTVPDDRSAHLGLKSGACARTTKTNSILNVAVGTTKKSTATRSFKCRSRNGRQVAEGNLSPCGLYFSTVDFATSIPSL